MKLVDDGFFLRRDKWSPGDFLYMKHDIIIFNANNDKRRPALFLEDLNAKDWRVCKDNDFFQDTVQLNGYTYKRV